MATGERITRPDQLMLRDIVHFTKASMEWNRIRDYKVVTLRQDSITVEARSTFITDDVFYYTILASQLEALGTEIIT